MIIDVIVQAPERVSVAESPLEERGNEGVVTVSGAGDRFGQRQINVSMALSHEQLTRLRDDLTRFLVRHPGPS